MVVFALDLPFGADAVGFAAASSLCGWVEVVGFGTTARVAGLETARWRLSGPGARATAAGVDTDEGNGIGTDAGAGVGFGAADVGTRITLGDVGTGMTTDGSIVLVVGETGRGRYSGPGARAMAAGAGTDDDDGTGTAAAAGAGVGVGVGADAGTRIAVGDVGTETTTDGSIGLVAAEMGFEVEGVSAWAADSPPSVE